MANYDTWRRRVRDHPVGTNINYSKFLETIEKEKVPIRGCTLATTYIPALPHLNWEWATSHLWTLTGGCLEDCLLNGRIMICPGEEFNGLNMWRFLYKLNSGGSGQLENIGRTKLCCVSNSVKKSLISKPTWRNGCN